MVLPESTNTPPQLPEYHFHSAPVPRLPPFTVNCDELFWQIGDVPDTDVGAIDSTPSDVTIKSEELAEHPLNVAVRLYVPVVSVLIFFVDALNPPPDFVQLYVNKSVHVEVIVPVSVPAVPVGIRFKAVPVS